MKEVLCGLDIGSSKLSAVLARGTRERMELLESETLSVRGLDRGIVKDLAGLVDCIGSILEKINVKTKTRSKKILISVNGNYISARNSFATLAFSERANRHVTHSDINYLRRQARLLGLHIDELLLHEFPQDYVLDDNHYTFNPLGLLARKIQLNSYLLSASHSFLGNITAAVNQAGYEVLETVFSGVASSLCVTTEEEKRKGIILIDMGACFTNMLFFKDGILRDYSTIRFGGNDITNDISSGLGLPWELAEEIKKSSLILSSTDSSRSDSLVIKRTGSYKTFERRKLYESVKHRLEKFVESINDAIKTSSWGNTMECGIVGIGGTAYIEGMLEKIEFCTGQSVRLGNIKIYSPSRDSLDSQYAAAVGLLYYWSASKRREHLKNCFMGRNYLERSVNFVQHLFREYF